MSEEMEAEAEDPEEADEAEEAEEGAATDAGIRQNQKAHRHKYQVSYPDTTCCL